MRLALLLSVLALVVAEPAAASTYPNERPAPEFVQALARQADAFWKARGVPACAATRTVLTAPSLMDADGVDAAGRGAPNDGRADGCQMWVARWLVRDAAGSLYTDGSAILCAVIFHEAGHTGLLGHSATGLMTPELSTVPFECKVWARRFEASKQRALDRARSAKRKARR